MKIHYKNYGYPDDFHSNCIAFDPKENCYYLVGKNHDVLKFANTSFPKYEQLGFLGEWKLKSLFIDSNGTKWGVNNENGALGKMNGNETRWTLVNVPNGMPLMMATVAPDGNIWGVRHDGKVIEKSGVNWKSIGELGGWKLQWITFNPKNPKEIYCVGGDNRVGVCTKNTKMHRINPNWDNVKSMLFNKQDNLVMAIGMISDVGVSFGF